MSVGILTRCAWRPADQRRATRAGNEPDEDGAGCSAWRLSVEFLILLAIAVAVLAFLSHEDEDDDDRPRR